MDILLSRGTRPEDKKISFNVEAVIKKIYPDSTPFLLPDWLKSGNVPYLFEVDKCLGMVSVWASDSTLDDVNKLFQMKAKWECWVKSFNEQNETVMLILGERVPGFLLSVFASVKGVRIFDLVFLSEENKLVVKELGAPEENVKRERESAPKGDVSLSSFFYKLGRLSVDELSEFIDVEADFQKGNVI